MAKVYKVLWTGAAQADLESVVDFIAKENPITALRLFRFVRLKARGLNRYPERGRRPPEIAHMRGLPFRELILTPWRLMYRIQGRTVEVLAFFDGRRDLEEVIQERLFPPAG